VVVQFINQIVKSSSIYGQAFFVYFLQKYKVPIPEAIGRAILEITTMFMAFGTFLVISVMLMGRQGIFVNHPETLIIVYVFLGMAVFWVGLFFVLQRKTVTEGRVIKWLSKKFYNYHVGSFFEQLKTSLNIKTLRKKGYVFWAAYLWQNLSFLANVFTVFFAARAIGIEISFVVAFITFSLARFSAAVATVPGGIGVYETISTLSLVAFGLDAGAALAISLVTRAFTFWLPIPIGWMIYQVMAKRIEESKGQLQENRG